MPAEGETTGAPTPLRILVTVTFNPNQLRSHLLPILALPEVESVTLVADALPPPLPKLRAVVPPRLLMRVFGRAGAKLLVCLWLARRERPDWIVGFNFVPHGFNARVVGSWTGTKSLYHMIGGETEWRGGGWSSDNSALGRLPFRFQPLERLLLRLIAGCTVVATMGESGRASLVERGIDESRTRIVRPSVDTHRFERSGRSEAPRYDVVTVGQLIPRKRIEDLVRAVAQLRDRRRRVRAAIVGRGPLDGELRCLAAELGVDELIEFIGFCEDVETVYRAARVFVLPSASEGLPISMLEAMATGLPPVVSDVGENAGFVSHGESGYLFPVGRIDVLAEHVSRLLDDDDLRHRIGAAAAKKVREAASVEAVSTEYHDLFSRWRT